MPTIRIPNSWNPRSHQLNLWRYLEGGGRRAAAVWHRRAGKDSTALNWTATAAHERIGAYWHMLPEQAQARKVIWDGIDREGRRMIDQAFPREIRAATNKQEMKLELKCGSIWQCVGSDNYNSLVGGNPVGVVFSEWSIADPSAWDFIRPILAENGGWALFIYTARGRNHGASLYEMALGNPSWFAEKLTVDDTGIIPPEAIEEERLAGMPDEMVDQEFYCSFEAALVGSYYGKLIAQAEQEDRITSVPYEPTVPVQTWWDIGYGDATAIWFVQLIQRQIRVIDYYESSGVGAEHYVKVLQDKGYIYGDPRRPNSGHLFPHDMSAGEWGTGRTRFEVMESLGVRGTIVPKMDVDDGIQAVRAILPRCHFDGEKCQRGIEALRQYRREWDDKLKNWKGRPLHDWASHAADGFRYGAVGMMEVPQRIPGRIDRWDAAFEDVEDNSWKVV